MTDSRVAVELWEATPLEDRVTSMACSLKCPVHDVVKCWWTIYVLFCVSSRCQLEGDVRPGDTKKLVLPITNSQPPMSC